ncbi:putative RNA polymerase II nuclear localization protein SLC7A6OS [Caenorhabditis elegans]|uniref:Probable RNA polymerase II nuclear localization protein SLC7A6OS n=1 Tax=Caenorhabditis elegans TaxID=6239 RepID=Q9XVH5_CAEEL|nr:putative RNA polymerase II nuclear localization protein SLC7A6OS [Caenorhabditis elegans]CAB03456.1 Probable RNA polymerase II nuclear localization protein SLC7A6OS [Caenorhabditis elegans]|eukprot:NP_496943.1 Uncharacterized protein CELE_W01G7.4 [Caenorhabditis elegans]
MTAPLIRVSRKRTADPHDALILHTKRAKHGGNPLVFTLYKAAGNDLELNGARVLDLPTQEHGMELADEENPLGFVKDEAVGLVGEVEKNVKKPAEQVSLNGRLLQPVTDGGGAAAGSSDDVVYDYYAIHEKRGNPEVVGNLEQDIEGADFRFAKRDELDLGDEDDSDGPPADDEDDSNDEDNWRNDYPDEESYDEDSDNGDPYGISEPDHWHAGEEAYSDESFHRRLQNMDLNDERYEAFYEGDETDEDAD